MGLFLVLIITQIPQSVRNHKINVCRDKVDDYFDYVRSDDYKKGWRTLSQREKDKRNERRLELDELSKGCFSYGRVQSGRT